MVAPLVLLGGGAVLAGAAGLARALRRSPSIRGVLPAFPRIVALSPEQRAAVLQAAKVIGINPIALADVIQSESGWDPTAPHEATGTPRGGLNQLTEAAHVPGFNTAESVWAIRSQPLEWQLEHTVIPYFLQVKETAPDWREDWPAIEIYKLNFLPADRKKPDDYHLGELGSSERVGHVTRDLIYRDNPGFDPQKKGYFTWRDVQNRVEAVHRQAKGMVIDVAGKIRPEGSA